MTPDALPDKSAIDRYQGTIFAAFVVYVIVVAAIGIAGAYGVQTTYWLLAGPCIAVLLGAFVRTLVREVRNEWRRDRA